MTTLFSAPGPVFRREGPDTAVIHFFFSSALHRELWAVTLLRFSLFFLFLSPLCSKLSDLTTRPPTAVFYLLSSIFFRLCPLTFLLRPILLYALYCPIFIFPTLGTSSCSLLIAFQRSQEHAEKLQDPFAVKLPGFEVGRRREHLSQNLCSGKQVFEEKGKPLRSPKL